MQPKVDTDLQLATLAGAQHGVVARRQLLQLGVSAEAIKRRAAAGRLHRLHRGVFAVGHTALRAEGHWMAAVLALGGDAVLSHATAAAAWDLRRRGPGAIHVTVPSTPGRKQRRGIRLHRSGTLTPNDTTTHRGIPITTPARTIIYLARTLEGRPLDHALDLAEQRSLIDFAELHQRPIPPSLQAVLSRYTAGASITRSEMEERFLALCDDHGIPRPSVNIRVEDQEVDFVWRDARLTVEVDGYAYHRSPTAFETDRERRCDSRDRRLAGIAVHVDPDHHATGVGRPSRAAATLIVVGAAVLVASLWLPRVRPESFEDFYGTYGGRLGIPTGIPDDPELDPLPGWFFPIPAAGQVVLAWLASYVALRPDRGAAIATAVAIVLWVLGAVVLFPGLDAPPFERLAGTWVAAAAAAVTALGLLALGSRRRHS